jgi:hypothetical protein
MTSFIQRTGLAVAAIGGLLAATALSTPSASAAVVPFTWNPQFTAPFSGNPNVDSTFTADNVGGLDYDHISINPATGAFTESGIIDETAFALAGSGVALPHLEQGYALYLVYSGSGFQTPGVLVPGATLTGSFTSLTFDFYEALSKPTYGVTTAGPTISGTTNATHLASGSLVSGSSTVSVAEAPNGDLSASASLRTTFNIDPSATGFFVAPSILNIQFVAATNTASVLSNPTPTDVLITGGGANLTYGTVIPEPASLALLSGGLLGVAGLVRRRQGRA